MGVGAAVVALTLSGCATNAESPSQTSSGQAASVPPAPSPLMSSASPSPSASVPPSGTPETSSSPSARAMVDPDAKVIYLTFDDGPWVPYTQQILDILAKYDAQATFFMVGEMAAQHKDLVRKVKAAGHAIGNHTWDHANLTTLSDAQIIEELQRTEHTLATVGPVLGACMRPPYGATNSHIRSLAKKQGYHTYLWDYWAEDWNQPPIPQFLQSLETATEPGSNILLHDGGGDRPNTVEAMRIMIPRWIKKGYTFQALPACLPLHGN